MTEEGRLDRPTGATTDPAVRALLNRWNDGDRSAAAEILPFVYDDLRRIARRHFRREHGYRTLQPTAAVHEAYLRLESSFVEIKDRKHLLALLVRLMRQVLVDCARERGAAKRGGGVTRVVLDDFAAGSESLDLQVLDLEGALRKLAELDPRKSDVVELRFFGGMTVEEISELLNLSVATVNREWRKARAWLLRELADAG